MTQGKYELKVGWSWPVCWKKYGKDKYDPFLQVEGQYEPFFHIKIIFLSLII